jgi:hypothetical protein
MNGSYPPGPPQGPYGPPAPPYPPQSFQPYPPRSYQPYPHPSYPPYTQPISPAPPKRSRVGLWIALGALSLFGACGVLVAVAPEPEPTVAADERSDKDAPAAEAKAIRDEGATEAAVADGAQQDAPKPAGIELRNDVPKGAAITIKAAREAIAARDFDALEKLLYKAGQYRISDDLEAQSRRAAIDGWRKNPKELDKLDSALAAKCEVDPPEEGQILISCGKSRSGAAFVILDNTTEHGDSGKRFFIVGTGTVY